MHVFRKPFQQLEPPAVPGRVLFAVKQLVSQIVGLDDRAGHHGRDLLARAGQAEDVGVDEVLPFLDLRHAFGAFAGLRVVDQDKVRPQFPALGRSVRHAANTAVHRRGGDDCPAGRRIADARKDHRRVLPYDMGSFPAPRLPPASVGDAFQGLDRIAYFREVGHEVFVSFERRLDGSERFLGGIAGGADHYDEPPVPVHCRPDRGSFAKDRLASPPGHRNGELPARDSRRLKPIDGLQLHRRPGQVEDFRKVGLAEFFQVFPAALPSGWVCHFRYFPDVATFR